MELYWVTSVDEETSAGGSTTRARPELGKMNLDGSVQVTTPVSSTGTDRIHTKTTISITTEFTPSDEILAFAIGRQSAFDTNTGKVGLLQSPVYRQKRSLVPSAREPSAAGRARPRL